MKKILAKVLRFSLVLVMVMGLLAAGPGAGKTLAQASVSHVVFEEPVDEVVTNPCAGEDIYVSGSVHVETQTLTDNRGVTHLHFSANDHDVVGVGLTSGVQYHRVGATTDQVKIISGPLPVVETFTNTFDFIGQGPRNNVTIKETFHVTVNANGTTTVDFDRIRFECR